MDGTLEHEWKVLVKQLEQQFDAHLDLDGVLFLIGVQELGKGFRQFTKDEKLDVMHIAICTLLADYGYYTYKGRDEDGWPHWERVKKLPALSANEQAILMKQSILNYFRTH